MFQYISCCSLSSDKKFNMKFNYLFQYISCCSLSMSWFYIPPIFHCFNTSHVVVYLGSCYFYFSSCRFNTSHVVVYRWVVVAATIQVQFQYISCCSLSKNGVYWWWNFFKFQYISCCSLSIVVFGNPETV